MVFFAEKIERRDEAHPEEERVARLRDIRCVFEVVVAVAFVIRGSQGKKQRAEPVYREGERSQEMVASGGLGECGKKEDSPRSNSTPSILAKLSNMSPMQTRISSDENESASNDQLWRLPTSLIRSSEDTAGKVSEGRRSMGGVDGVVSRKGEVGAAEVGNGFKLVSVVEMEAFREVTGEAIGEAGMDSRWCGCTSGSDPLARAAEFEPSSAL